MECRDHDLPLRPTHDRTSVSQEFFTVRRGTRDRRHGRQATVPAPASATVDAWLAWFDTYKQAACRAFLCTRYRLNALDAEVLMNTARLQVFLHWATVQNPLAYFWQTLRHAVGKQGRRQAHERQRLAAYAQQYRTHAHGTARTAQHVAAVLERVPSRQRQCLEWYAQGYEDTQVAAWLGISPQAVRVARHTAYRTFRAQLRRPADGGRPRPHPRQENNFFGMP